MLKDMIQNPAKYRKFYTALATAVVTLLTIQFGSAVWLPVLVNFLGAIGVLAVPNQPKL
jgi:hypothetical protein